MKRITNCGGYVAPKVKVATLKCDFCSVMSNVEGTSGITDWIDDGEDSADE